MGVCSESANWIGIILLMIRIGWTRIRRMRTRCGRKLHFYDGAMDGQSQQICILKLERPNSFVWHLDRTRLQPDCQFIQIFIAERISAKRNETIWTRRERKYYQRNKTEQPRYVFPCVLSRVLTFAENGTTFQPKDEATVDFLKCYAWICSTLRLLNIRIMVCAFVWTSCLLLGNNGWNTNFKKEMCFCGPVKK